MKMYQLRALFELGLIPDYLTNAWSENRKKENRKSGKMNDPTAFDPKNDLFKRWVSTRQSAIVTAFLFTASLGITITLFYSPGMEAQAVSVSVALTLTMVTMICYGYGTFRRSTCSDFAKDLEKLDDSLRISDLYQDSLNFGIYALLKAASDSKRIQAAAKDVLARQKGLLFRQERVFGRVSSQARGAELVLVNHYDILSRFGLVNEDDLRSMSGIVEPQFGADDAISGLAEPSKAQVDLASPAPQSTG